jgi:hypothetical protein
VNGRATAPKGAQRDRRMSALRIDVMRADPGGADALAPVGAGHARAACFGKRPRIDARTEPGRA